MKQVKKANRIIKIQDDQLKGYLENGYVEIDDKGKPINVPKPKDVKTLEAKVKKLEAENKELKVKVEELSKPKDK